MSTGSPAVDGLLAAGGAFIITWVLSFLVRLAKTPVTLYYDEKRRADALEKSAHGGIGPNTRHDALKLLVGDAPLFADIATSPAGTKRRTVKIAVRNDGNGFVSNCELRMVGKWEKLGDYDAQIPLFGSQGFDLLPLQIKYIDVACYDEEFQTPETQSKDIWYCLPPSGGFFDSGLTSPANRRQTVTFVVKTTEASAASLLCEIWVDFKGPHPRLRLTEA